MQMPRRPERVVVLEPQAETEQLSLWTSPRRRGRVASSSSSGMTSVSEPPSPVGSVPGPVVRGEGPVPSSFVPGLSVGLPGVVMMSGCQAAGTSDSHTLFFWPLVIASALL
jgi:hypothetical protein